MTSRCLLCKMYLNVNLLLLQEHKIAPHPFLEFYKDGKIHFVAPLERCSEFYVPEYQGNKE